MSSHFAATHPDLTVYQYATLLFDAFTKLGAKLSRSELMTQCVEMSFFVTAPNQTMHQITAQREYEQYMKPLNTVFEKSMANLIITFLVAKRIDETDDAYVRWDSSQDHEGFVDQLHFSNRDHTFAICAMIGLMRGHRC